MPQLPRPEHPRPDFVRPQWMSLNGEWQFAFDDLDRGLGEGWYRPGKALNGRITVPFCYQSPLSGVGVREKHPVLWYRRGFRLPQEMAGRSILLRFGAVDFSCRVFLNGLQVGAHRGGYTPFALDVTRFLRQGDNDLCLRVEDYGDCTQPRGKQNWKDDWFACWYTPVSGIWQSVYLEAAGWPYLTQVHITPDIDQGLAFIRLTLNQMPSSPVTASLTVKLGEKIVCSMRQQLSQRSQRLTVDMVDGGEIQGFRTWTPEDPALYEVSVALEGGDQVETYFGMRKVEVQEGRVLLNNRPLYQRLVLDQGYWPQSLITPPSDEAIRRDIEWTKALGFNGARKHQKLEDPRYYYWADRMGLLVWGEVPSAYEFTQESVMNLSHTLAGFIDRDYNHPCLIAWVPLNESWGVDRIGHDKRMQAAALMLYHQAKALDGTRLVSSNDGWEQVTTDIYALHDYAAWGDTLSRHFGDPDNLAKGSNDHHLCWAEGFQPTGREAFMVTEFGGIAVDAQGEIDGAWGYHDKVKDGQALLERYRSVVEAVRAIPHCQGYCYTQLTDVEQEVNGLLTVNRQPKADPEAIAAVTGQGPL